MTFVEVLVSLIATTLVVVAASGLYSSSLVFYGIAKGTARSLPLHAAGDDDLVSTARQTFFDRESTAGSDVRVVDGVQVAGVAQTVATYNLVRQYSARIEPAKDWSTTDSAGGTPMTGVIFLLQRDPIECAPDEVDPDDPVAPALRFLESRLMRLEIRQADAVAFGLPQQRFTEVPVPVLAGFLSRQEIWRCAETVFDNVYRVRFDHSAGGLAFSVALYHKRL